MPEITAFIEIYSERNDRQSPEETKKRLDYVLISVSTPKMLNDVFERLVLTNDLTVGLQVACDVVSVLHLIDDVMSVVLVMKKLILWFISKEKVKSIDVDWQDAVYPMHRYFIRMLFKCFNRQLSEPIGELVQVYVDTQIYAVEIGDYVYSEFTKIGEGKSLVYRGICPAFGEQVAVKVIKHPTHNVKRFKKYLRREILILQTSHSPKIVGLNVAYHGEHVTFLVMEMLEGDLRSLIRDKHGANRRLELPEAVHYLREIISVVSYFHIQLDGDHRDIKPGNLLYYHDDEGIIRLKLGDFGMSKITSQGEERPSLDVAGTPFYWAPEIHALEGIKDNSDLYSIGVIGYEMIFGEKVADLVHVHKRIASIKNGIVRSVLMGLYQPYESRFSWEELLMHDFMIGENKKSYDKRRKVEVCSALQDIAVLMEKKNREIERNIYELEKRSISISEVSSVSSTMSIGDFSDIRNRENEASKSLLKSYESELEEITEYNKRLHDENEKLEKRIEEKVELELQTSKLEREIANLKKIGFRLPQSHELPDVSILTDPREISITTHCNTILEVVESSQELNEEVARIVLLEIYHIIEIHNTLVYTDSLKTLMHDTLEICFSVYNISALSFVILLMHEEINAIGRILVFLRKDLQNDVSAKFSTYKRVLKEIGILQN